MKSRILVKLILIFTIILSSCSMRNKVTISKDWLEHTEEDYIIISPGNQKIFTQNKDTIDEFFNLINNLEYNRVLSEEEGEKEGVFKPGTEYHFFLTNSDFDDKLHIIYGKRDQALGVRDKIYFLNKDISEEIKQWIDEMN